MTKPCMRTRPARDRGRDGGGTGVRSRGGSGRGGRSPGRVIRSAARRAGNWRSSARSGTATGASELWVSTQGPCRNEVCSRSNRRADEADAATYRGELPSLMRVTPCLGVGLDEQVEHDAGPGLERGAPLLEELDDAGRCGGTDSGGGATVVAELDQPAVCGRSA